MALKYFELAVRCGYKEARFNVALALGAIGSVTLCTLEILKKYHADSTSTKR